MYLCTTMTTQECQHTAVLREFDFGSQARLDLVSVLVFPHLQPTLIFIACPKVSIEKNMKILKISLFLMADKTSSKKSTSIKVLFVPTTTL